MRQAQIEAIEQRRRTVRAILGGIIVLTLPFYCAGIVLWGTAPPRSQAERTPTMLATQPILATGTPNIVTATLDGPPTITPLPITVGVPTPIEFPTPIPLPTQTLIFPTPFLSPTPPVVLPTQPPLPTAVPPTQPPTITWTPLPFDQ